MITDDLSSSIAELVGALTTVGGVCAVSLGGSRATGRADAASDVDLGVYYDAATLDVDRLAVLVSDRGGELHRPGEWGPWVDGGAWLTVDGTPLDLILRDVARVREQVGRARSGVFAFHAQAGHPLGFLDVAYAGEVAVAVPLADPHGVLAEWREQVTPYPPALRMSMLAQLWQVDFLLDGGLKGARRGDVAYVSLCLTHVAMLVAHAWHAFAGVWVLNEKGLVPGVARLDLDSGGFATTVGAILAGTGSTPAELTDAIERMRAAPRPTR